MVRIEPTRFAKEVIEVAVRYKEVVSYDVEILDNIITKIRIYFRKKNVFIDVFYNSDTGRKAYALIRNDKRILGADNTGRWHIHPFETVTVHRWCKEVKFSSFIEQAIRKLFRKNKGV